MREHLYKKKKEELHKQSFEKETRQNKERQTAPSFRSSEAIYHWHGGNSLEEKDNMTGVHEREPKKQTEENLKESFRAENSYGNISVGANERKETAIVFSEKRVPNGSMAKEEEKQLHMEHKKERGLAGGRVVRNSSDRGEGAIGYVGKTDMTEKKTMPRLEEIYKQMPHRMMSKRMSFLKLPKEREKLRELYQAQRTFREQGERVGADRLEGQIRALSREISQQEQEKQAMKKQLSFAWEKARINSRKGSELLRRQKGYEEELIPEGEPEKPEE